MRRWQRRPAWCAQPEANGDKVDSFRERERKRRKLVHCTRSTHNRISNGSTMSWWQCQATLAISIPFDSSIDVSLRASVVRFEWERRKCRKYDFFLFHSLHQYPICSHKHTALVVIHKCIYVLMCVVYDWQYRFNMLFATTTTTTNTPMSMLLEFYKHRLGGRAYQKKNKNNPLPREAVINVIAVSSLRCILHLLPTLRQQRTRWLMVFTLLCVCLATSVEHKTGPQKINTSSAVTNKTLTRASGYPLAIWLSANVR